MTPTPAMCYWPIYNPPITPATYPAPAGKILIDRTFRQALTEPAMSGVVDGLDLLIADDPEFYKLHACFSGGLMPINDGSGGATCTIKIFVFPRIQDKLKSLYRIEPTPGALVYENVDVASVKAYLKKIINQAIFDAPINTASWRDPKVAATIHPILLDKQIVEAAGQIGYAPPELDMSFYKNELNQFVDDLLDFKLPGEYCSLRAGDIFGDAASIGSSHPDLGVNVRRLTFKVEEPRELKANIGLQTRNPRYDFWRWIKGSATSPLTPAKAITLKSPHRLDAAPAHPLLALTGPYALDACPPARLTEGQIIQIPAGKMTQYHTRYPKKIQSMGQPLLEWRINPNTRHFEARGILGPVTLYDTTPGQMHATAVATVWQKFAADIATFSSLLQVPCEVVVATLAAESGSQPRAAAIEGDIPSQRERLDKGVNKTARYLELMEIYTKILPNEDARITSQIVPDPIQTDVNTAVIKTVGPYTLTWGNLAELAGMSPFICLRVSIGLLQTMITTARGMIGWVARLEPDLKHSYPLNQAASLWSLLNIAPPPSTAHDYLFNWLTVPRHSILVGMALMRNNYLGIGVEQTYWDPPRTAASYARGSIFDITKDATCDWGMGQRPLMDYWCKYYNAAVNLFDTQPTVKPAVRLGV